VGAGWLDVARLMDLSNSRMRLMLTANEFYKCASCLHAKMKQRAFNHTQSGTPSRTITADEDKVEWTKL
jgi:hypothetical protein